MPDETEMAKSFALAHGPPASLPPPPPSPAPAAHPGNRSSGRAEWEQRLQQWQERRLEQPYIFLNYQGLNKATDTEMTQLCRLGALAHAAAFNPRRLWCLCASPVGVGVGC